MPTYAYRIRVLLSHFLDHPDPTIALTLGSRNVQIASRHSEPLKDSRNVVFSCDGFLIEEEARREGKRLISSLRIAAMESRMGINLGQNCPTLQIADHVKKSVWDKTGVWLADDVHGLFVYNAERPTSFPSTQIHAKVSHRGDDFRAKLSTAHDRVRQPFNPKLALAMDVYSLSFFQTSSQAQFLTLVSAAELMTPILPRNDRVKSHIRELQDATFQSDLGDDDKRRLAAALSHLGNESIKTSMKAFAEASLGPREVLNESLSAFIDVCYDVRSSLSHKGAEPSKAPNIDVLSGALGPLVAEMIQQQLKESQVVA